MFEAISKIHLYIHVNQKCLSVIVKWNNTF